MPGDRHRQVLSIMAYASRIELYVSSGVTYAIEMVAFLSGKSKGN
jgi:hypothetical protein